MQKLSSMIIKRRREEPLNKSMFRMLLFGWFIPLILMLVIVSSLSYGKINEQVRNMATADNDHAVDICDMRLKDCVTASKNASYFPEIRDCYTKYKSDFDSKSLYNNTLLFLEQQYRYNISFRTAVLYYTDNPQKLYYTYNNTAGASYQNIKDFGQNALDKVISLASVMDTATRLYNCDNAVYMVRNLLDSSFKPYATLSMELNTDSVFESLKNVNGYCDSEIYQDGILLWGNGPDERYNEIRTRALSEAGTDVTRFYERNTDSFVTKTLMLGNTKLICISRLNSRQLFSETNLFHYVFIILIIFMIPLFFIVMSFFRNRVARPLQQMVAASSEIEEGNYGYQIDSLAASQEFRRTETAFNNMSVQLKNQFEKIYVEEILIRDAKIMALQSQINPHFLNNTLEIVNWQARMAGNYKVSGMIEALSTMLEATMNRKDESLVPLSEEMSYVDAYLYIISERFGDKFASEKILDQSLSEVMVPRLIVQPIVENAVEHGIDSRTGGRITIRTSRREDILFIEVEDSGSLSMQQSENIAKLLNDKVDMTHEGHVSLGIHNVNQRLKMMYGREYGLHIENNLEGHTVSVLKIHIKSEDAGKTAAAPCRPKNVINGDNNANGGMQI